MKFIYPYKLYCIGLIVFILFSIYGFFEIYDLSKSKMILIVLYMVFCVAVVLWYYENYSYYKNMYVVVSNDSIIIKKDGVLEKIIRSDLEYIIEANHRQRLKIYNVIHIFTKDNRYFYLTREINSFKRLKKQLNVNFKDVYIKKEKVISSNFVVNKKNLTKVI
ncbi:MAG: hypothetical protein N4A62_13065 [Marinisporobacter sp.]|nr:hypothetical protein [Marinisporobacter sp.]